jgi:hypothetical protein
VSATAGNAGSQLLADQNGAETTAQRTQIIHDRGPHHQIVNRVVFVLHHVAHTDDLAELRNRVANGRIEVIDAKECLAQDRELSFNGSAVDLVSFVSFE